jgi:hypothetical protein
LTTLEQTPLTGTRKSDALDANQIQSGQCRSLRQVNAANLIV